MEFDDVVSRLKRLTGLDEPPTEPYVCQACQASYGVQYHVCPECGGYSVEPQREEKSSVHF